VPAAVGLFGRGLTWADVVSGMLRMRLVAEFLRNLERKRLIDREGYLGPWGGRAL
jgi:hypothetical protein